MKEGEIWEALKVQGCQLISIIEVGERFQDVEFRVSSSVDIVALLKTLRQYDFYELRLDSSDADVIVGTRDLL